MSVSFRVVGVESGQVLAAKTASRKWEGINIVDPRPGNDAIVASPPKSITLPAQSTILEQLTDEVVAEMVGVISPHQRRVQTVWLPADYDGDGKADLAVFRPSTGARESRSTRVVFGNPRGSA